MARTVELAEVHALPDPEEGLAVPSKADLFTIMQAAVTAL